MAAKTRTKPRPKARPRTDQEISDALAEQTRLLAVINAEGVDECFEAAVRCEAGAIESYRTFSAADRLDCARFLVFLFEARRALREKAGMASDPPFEDDA